MDRMAFNAAVAMTEQTVSRQMSVNELANAKAIETSSTMTSAIINLRS